MPSLKDCGGNVMCFYYDLTYLRLLFLGELFGIVMPIKGYLRENHLHTGKLSRYIFERISSKWQS